jgi:hypothetical protein
MNKGIAGKHLGSVAPHRLYIVWGSTIFVVGAALAIVFSYLAPSQSRACALMPGFCAQKGQERKSKHFQEVDSMKRGGAKFDLTPTMPHLH